MSVQTVLDTNFELLDHIPVGAFVLREDLSVVYWNRWLEEATNIPKSAIMGEKIHERYPHFLELKYATRIEAMFSGGPPAIFSSLLHKFIIPIEQKDGQYRIQHTTATPIPSPEGGIYVLFTIQDVTDLNYRVQEYRVMHKKALKEIEERKQTEIKLREAKERAEEATRLKDKFVSLVSHDLKGPLGSLLGLLKFLRDEYLRDYDENAKSLHASAIESAENMLMLTNDLLNVGRLKTGKIKPIMAFLDAHMLGSKAELAMGNMARKKGITLENRIPLNTRIYADTALLYEAISNMVSNAIKFSRNGGVISISVPEGEKTTISISDTGVGIPKDRMEHLFDYEEKTSTMGTSGEVGTGMGLPLSNDIVKAHGGSIVVESEEGKGSTFHIRLPEVKPRVLLVDDDHPSRLLFRGYLGKLDVEVVEAQNGTEALETLGKHPPHLVITDISMPEMDGFGLVQTIKSRRGTMGIPVVVITADLDAETRERAMRLGANDIFPKTVEMGAFLARVAHFFG